MKDRALGKIQSNIDAIRNERLSHERDCKDLSAIVRTARSEALSHCDHTGWLACLLMSDLAETTSGSQSRRPLIATRTFNIALLLVRQDAVVTTSRHHTINQCRIHHTGGWFANLTRDEYTATTTPSDGAEAGIAKAALNVAHCTLRNNILACAKDAILDRTEITVTFDKRYSNSRWHDKEIRNIDRPLDRKWKHGQRRLDLNRVSDGMGRNKLQCTSGSHGM